MHISRQIRYGIKESRGLRQKLSLQRQKKQTVMLSPVRGSLLIQLVHLFRLTRMGLEWLLEMYNFLIKQKTITVS